MKRLSTHRFSTDWSLCCICQSSVDSGSLKVEKLADQFLVFWENGLLQFDASLVSDGQVHGKPNFKECMLRNNAVYHHDCYSNFSDYKLHIKLKSKKRKLEKSTENAGPSISLRSHCENVPSMVMCYICGEEDMLCNLHAAGAKSATKDTLNYGNVCAAIIEMSPLIHKFADAKVDTSHDSPIFCIATAYLCHMDLTELMLSGTDTSKTVKRTN